MMGQDLREFAAADSPTLGPSNGAKIWIYTDACIPEPPIHGYKDIQGDAHGSPNFSCRGFRNDAAHHSCNPGNARVENLRRSQKRSNGDKAVSKTPSRRR